MGPGGASVMRHVVVSGVSLIRVFPSDSAFGGAGNGDGPLS